MQKIVVIIMIFISGVLTSLAQDKHIITIEFTGMESDKGSLFVALYNKETDFLKKPYRRKIVEINNKKATVVFEGILPGVYAVSSFHDENDNKKMDTRMFGIPKEPIGTSNNAKGFMGPPKYKDAKFEVKENSTLQIKVN
ncbi:DUF2141 domain-containing protein [Tenacibaculum sp. nBUS_03]|uniref:DUF2141 domain-containing protein n=1 Tax=Tenacibaculum sp. nBUS_03 TaxID=3395320 RepID=UPI003EC0940F